MSTILITGVSDGIGHALAHQYAAGGAHVLGLGRRAWPSTLAGCVAPEDYCVVDLRAATAAAAVQAFLAARGVTHLDLLVHNAAAGWYGPVAQQPAAVIDELLAVNLNAPIALTHTLLPLLRAAHEGAAHGVIAFVSSVHSALPTPDFAVYTATKAALDGFARSLRSEVRGAVDVLVLWPGPTRTRLHSRSGIPPERIKADRYATPESVARQMVAAIERRRSRTLGTGNQLLRWVATHCEPLVDGAMAIAARRAAQR